MPIHNNQKGRIKSAWEWYKVNFNAKLFSLFSIISVILISLFLIYPDQRDELKYVTTVLIAFSGVGSAIYLGRSLVKRLQHDRIKNSFQFSKFFDDPELNALKDKVKENYHKRKVAPEKLVRDVKADKELLHQLKTVFGKFEDVLLQFSMVLLMRKCYIDPLII